MPRYHDVTLPLAPGLPSWPGMPPLEIEKIRSQDRGDSANVSRLSTYVHAGTHVDAPNHFLDSPVGVDALPLDVLIGPCRVVHFPDAAAVTADLLESAGLPDDTRRLLIRTRNSELWNQPDHAFREDYVGIAADAAEWMVARGIQLVGIDYHSIECFKAPGHPAHMALLGASVVAIENLDLRNIQPGAYGMICLPIRLKGADGAPARVILIED